MLSITNACNDAETASDPTVKTSVDPSNPNNPYDYVGELHNKGLRIAMDNCAKIENITTLELIKVSHIAANEVLAESPRTKGTTISTNTSLTEKNLNALYADIGNNFVNVINNLDISTVAKVEFNSLFSYLESVAGDADLTYAQLHQYIVNFENRIIREPFTLDTDTRIVLIGTSTLRYSLSYWEPTLTNTSDYVSDQLTSGKAPARRWWKWIIIAAADAGGALLGATSGSVIAGPAGAISGGVSGSITASSGAIGVVDKL